MKKFFEKLSSVDLFTSPSKRKYLLLISIILIIVAIGSLAVKHFYLDEDIRENHIPEVFLPPELEIPKLEIVESEHPIIEPTTPEEISELCVKYERYISEISCKEAARLALLEYVGKIHTIRPIPVFPNLENRWQIGINLITPIENRTAIEVL